MWLLPPRTALLSGMLWYWHNRNWGSLGTSTQSKCCLAFPPVTFTVTFTVIRCYWRSAIATALRGRGRKRKSKSGKNSLFAYSYPHRCKLRILALTDGADTGSSTTQKECGERLYKTGRKIEATEKGGEERYRSKRWPISVFFLSNCGGWCCDWQSEWGSSPKCCVQTDWGSLFFPFYPVRGKSDVK